MSAVPTPSQGRPPATVRRPALMGLGAMALVFLLAGCDGRPPEAARPDGTPALARVGEAIIRVEDLHREAERRNRGRRGLPEKEALVREMAENLALAQHARALGLDRDPAIAHEIQTLLVRRLLERELAPRLEAVDPTAAEVEAEYQRTLARYTQPAKDRLAILFLEVPANASAERRAEVRARLEEARRRASGTGATAAGDVPAPGFGPMSAEYSDDQASRHRGGDVGWLESGNFAYRWPRPLLEAGFALPKGGVSEVLETDKGLYLVMKTDTRPAEVRPLSEVEGALRQSLRAEQRRRIDAAYRREVSERVGLQVDAAAVAAVTLPVPVSNHMAQREEPTPPDLPDSGRPGR